MQSLKEREGTQIVALFPFIHKTTLQTVTLHRVEESGIWVESQTLTDAVLGVLGEATGSSTPYGSCRGIN